MSNSNAPIQVKISMTRWIDVLFVMLLLCVSVLVYLRDVKIAESYDAVYPTYQQEENLRYQEKSRLMVEKMIAEKKNFTKRKADADQYEQEKTAQHKIACEKKIDEIRQRANTMKSVLDDLKNRFDNAFRLGDSLSGTCKFLESVTCDLNLVKITFRDPGDKSEKVKVTLFSKYGLITGEVEYTIEPEYGLFGGNRLQANNTRELSCDFYNGEPKYCVVNVIGN